MARREIPALGFQIVSGKRNPPKDEKWYVQFRGGYVDEKHSYSAEQLRWKHNGSEWDVVAVKKA